MSTRMKTYVRKTTFCVLTLALFTLWVIFLPVRIVARLVIARQERDHDED